MNTFHDSKGFVVFVQLDPVDNLDEKDRLEAMASRLEHIASK